MMPSRNGNARRDPCQHDLPPRWIRTSTGSDNSLSRFCGRPLEVCLLLRSASSHGGQTKVKLNEMNKDLEERVAWEYNTFRVYLYVLKKKRVGVRDVQHDLDFSSPHLADYHLRKLKNIGLVKKENSKYVAVSKSFGVLRLFLVHDKWILPKTFFLVVLFLSMTVGFLIFFSQHPFFQVALVVSALGLVLSLYFTMQFYRILPKT